jgi:hypothetical protein
MEVHVVIIKAENVKDSRQDRFRLLTNVTNQLVQHMAISNLTPKEMKFVSESVMSTVEHWNYFSEDKK